MLEHDHDYDQREIAEALARSPGTISRELKRNCKSDGYYSDSYYVARYANWSAKLARERAV